MEKFIAEFKAFAVKGNVIDLSIAVVIGGAFGKIVSSLVTNIITPLVGLLIGGVNFSNLTYHVGEVDVTYGVFIQSVFDFLVISLTIFMMIKLVNKMEKGLDKDDSGQEEVKEVIKEPSEEVLLLREIRDELRRG